MLLKILFSFILFLYLFGTYSVSANHSVLHDEFGLTDMVQHEDGFFYIFSPNTRQRELNRLFTYEYATRLEHPDGPAVVNYSSNTHTFIWNPLNSNGQQITIDPFSFPFLQMEGFLYSVWCDILQDRTLYLFNPENVRNRHSINTRGTFALHDEYSLIRLVQSSNDVSISIRPNSRQTELANSFNISNAVRLEHPDGPATVGILSDPFRFIWIPLDITGTVLDIDPFSFPYNQMDGFLFSVWCDELQGNALYLFSPPTTARSVFNPNHDNNQPLVITDHNQPFVIAGYEVPASDILRIVVSFILIIPGILFLFYKHKKRKHMKGISHSRDEWNRKYTQMKEQWDVKYICKNCDGLAGKGFMCSRCKNYRAPIIDS